MEQLEFLSRAEVAKILNVKPRTLTEWRIKGKLPAYKVGKKILYKEDDIKKAIKPC